MSDSIHKMEKIKLNEELYQYYFVEEDQTSIVNIFAFIDKTGGQSKALLIDTGYPVFGEAVKKDLDSNGIKVEIIVLSHFHPDHTGGCSIFPGSRIYASRYYGDNFENCKRWKPGMKFLLPTHTIKDGDALTFGTFNLKFIEAPGHSRCSLLTIINDSVLHIGDLLMYDVGDKLTLPYISMGGKYTQYIASLERLKTMTYETILIPHGGDASKNKNRIPDAIDHYIYYLKKVLDSNGALPLSACLRNDVSGYAHPEFHENNQLQMMLQ